MDDIVGKERLCRNCMQDIGDMDVCPQCNTSADAGSGLGTENLCAFCMQEHKGQPSCPHCGRDAAGGSVPPHHLRPGILMNERYLLGCALGAGGFGITYIGRDIRLEKRVAIKEYYPSGFVNRNTTASSTITANIGNAEAVFIKGKEKFINEARILAKFSNEPGIVSVLDFFEANNTAYIVMDYLDGVTLKDHLEQNGVMSIGKTLELMSPVMRSLEHVHSQGLIHRDISPDNIMLMKNGDMKLLDFGTARNVTDIDQKSLSVMLKPGYAPEEQYRSRGEQGAWTDVYALCATIYRCITGVTPEDSMNRVFSDEVKTPGSMGIAIPPEQEAALMKGMAILQKNRTRNIGELREQFRVKTASERGQAAQPHPAPAPAPAPKPVYMPGPGGTQHTAMTGQAPPAQQQRTPAAGYGRQQSQPVYQPRQQPPPHQQQYGQPAAAGPGGSPYPAQNRQTQTQQPVTGAYGRPPAPAPGTYQPPYPPRPPKKNNTVIIVSIIAAAAVVLGVTLFVLLSNRSDSGGSGAPSGTYVASYYDYDLGMNIDIELIFTGNRFTIKALGIDMGSGTFTQSGSELALTMTSVLMDVYEETEYAYYDRQANTISLDGIVFRKQ